MFNLKQFLGLSYFISELDRFLKTYDEIHQKLSPSQRAEKEKHQRIDALRDNPQSNTKSAPNDTLWEGFYAGFMD